MSNKEEERRHLRTFLSKLDEAPKGERIFAGDNEVPDLKIDTDQGIIGVEHKRLYYPESDNGVIRQEQESLRSQVVQQAREIFASQKDIALDVVVSFRSLYGLAVDPTGIKLTTSKLHRVATELADFVGKNIPDPGQTLPLQPNVHQTDFPSEVSSIIVWRPKRPDRKEYVLWQSSEGGAVARFTPQFFEKRIVKYEKKIDSYREEGCREIWLLMAADGSNFSSWFDRELSDKAFEQCYLTEFDRLFVLSGPSLDLEELKTQSYAES